MNTRNFTIGIKAAVSAALLLISSVSLSQQTISPVITRLDSEIQELMQESDIPGLTIVFLQNDTSIVKTYGYADIERNEKVSSKTLFQLGSCSKAFTSLAVVKLVREGKLTFDQKLSEFLPWLHLYYKGKKAEITILQLLHHTSGIPWNTISEIPATSADNGLVKTIEVLQGQELNHLPGEEFEYATINYDILALVIQQITGTSFEKYIAQNIFAELKLTYTTIGKPLTSGQMSSGYKIGFFRANRYDAPEFAGNNAAGYVISNGEDMSKWLKFQMGIGDSLMYEAAKITHQRDETVAPHGMSFYAMGWESSLTGNGEMFHSGTNPNYTAYVALRPVKKLAVAVLANSNSPYTSIIGKRILEEAAGDLKSEHITGDNGIDKISSIITILLIGYMTVALLFNIIVVREVLNKKRVYAGLSSTTIKKLAWFVMCLFPFLAAIYLLPQAIAHFNWMSIVIWAPISFSWAVKAALIAAMFTFSSYFLTLCFPADDKLKRIMPRLVLLSVFSGIANMCLIVLITSALGSTMELKYLVFYYCFTLLVYLLGRRYVQVNLIRYSRELVYDLRVSLISKMFSTSYQRFEKLDHGRVYASLNDDVNIIGESSNLIVMLMTSLFTIIAAFVYLASAAFWTALITITLIVSLATLYFFVSRSNNKYFEQARNTVNTFMRLTKGMIDGFKEISLKKNKKRLYRHEMAQSALEFKDKMTLANVRFANAFMVGESLLVVLLGIVSLAMPKLFPDVPLHTLMTFVIVLLYLIGPINGVLNSVPSVINFRVAWNRVQQFVNEIPANTALEDETRVDITVIQSIHVEGVKFGYKNAGDNFEIGPIDLDISAGEIVFIIGGNGSGKTTLAKLLTGLYEPDAGIITIDGKAVKPDELSEYFSAVFSPPFIFDKIYDVNIAEKSDDIQKYLNLTNLTHKVKIDTDGRYSTTDLSGGQRKRLALLQCYLEDKPIYLFDEWAADQDPSYRSIFYRTLLPEMRKAGKIVIAITHDDHYFDVADKVMKMDQGQLILYENALQATARL
jgi:putative ATP-binding cassette transporter